MTRRVNSPRSLPGTLPSRGSDWRRFARRAMRWDGFRRFLPGALAALTAVDLTGAYALTGRVAHQDKPSVVAAGPRAIRLIDLGAGGFDRTIAAHGTTPTSTTTGRCSRPTRPCATSSTEHWALDRLLRPYVLGPQRVWFAADVPTVPVSGEVFEAFVQRAHALGALPVVRQERADLLHPTSGLPPAAAIEALLHAPVAQGLDCQVLAYHDNDLTLRVTCPRRRASCS